MFHKNDLQNENLIQNCIFIRYFNFCWSSDTARPRDAHASKNETHKNNPHKCFIKSETHKNETHQKFHKKWDSQKIIHKNGTHKNDPQRNPQK